MKYKLLFTYLILCPLFCINLFAQYKKVSSNGIDIYYRIFGEGEPLLIIGGGPGDNSDYYLSLAGLLSKNFKCILADQRGCGKSMPAKIDSTTITLKLTIDDFEAIRKEMKIKSWNVLGFSYGGFLASFYAENYPASVSSLILLGSMGLNANGFRIFMDNVASRLNQQDLDIVEYWSDSLRMNNNQQHAITEMIKAKMPGYFYDRKKSLLVSQIINDSTFNLNLGEWIFYDIFNHKIDLAMKDSNFKGLVLIIYGRQDPGGEGIPLGLKQYYKNSKLIFIEKAGHYSWVEQPEKVLKAITE